MMKASEKKILATMVIAATLTGTAAPAQVVVENANSSATLFPSASTRKAVVKRVNIQDQTGLFVPALEIVQPDGTIRYVPIGTEGLTRDIFYNDARLKSYVRGLEGFPEDSDDVVELDNTVPSGGTNISNPPPPVVTNPCAPVT